MMHRPDADGRGAHQDPPPPGTNRHPGARRDLSCAAPAACSATPVIPAHAGISQLARISFRSLLYSFFCSIILYACAPEPGST